MATDAVTPILPSPAQSAAPANARDDGDANVFASLLDAANDTPVAGDAQAAKTGTNLQDSALALQLVSQPVDTPTTETAAAAQTTDPQSAAKTPLVAQPNGPSTEEMPETPKPAIVRPEPQLTETKSSTKTDPADEKTTDASADSAATAQAVPAPTTPQSVLLAIQTLLNGNAQQSGETGKTDTSQPAEDKPLAKLGGAVPHKPGEAPAPTDVEPETPAAPSPRIAQTNAGDAQATLAKDATTRPAQSNPTQAIAPDASIAAAAAAPRSPVAQPSAPAQHTTVFSAAAGAVAHEIVRRFDGGNTSFQIRLDPPELGRVDVKLEVSHDKQVTATISAENPLTMKELISTSRDLQRALTDAGLNLADSGLNFSDRRETAPSAFDDTPLRGTNNSTTDDDVIARPPPARPFGVERWGGARVDVWV